MNPYVRPVHYYETDQMGIVHHSNYIRWFEEARLDQLDQLGLSYQKLEESGVIIPVVEVSCQYVHSARYGNRLEITPLLTQYTGVRMAYIYEVRIQGTGELCATGSSCHCFLDADRKPISLRRKYPQLHALLSDLVTPE